MRIVWIIVALVLAVVGLVWIGQGIGLIAGSAMTGSAFWGVVGLLLLIVAAVILVRQLRRRPG